MDQRLSDDTIRKIQEYAKKYDMSIPEAIENMVSTASAVDEETDEMYEEDLKNFVYDILDRVERCCEDFDLQHDDVLFDLLGIIFDILNRDESAEDYLNYLESIQD